MLEGILSKVYSPETMCAKGYQAYCPQIVEEAAKYGYGTLAAIVTGAAVVGAGAYAYLRNGNGQAATEANDEIAATTAPRRSARLAAKQNG